MNGGEITYTAQTLKEAVKLCKAADKLGLTYRLTKVEYSGLSSFPVGGYGYFKWKLELIDEEPTPDSTMPEEAPE